MIRVHRFRQLRLAGYRADLEEIVEVVAAARGIDAWNRPNMLITQTESSGSSHRHLWWNPENWLVANAHTTLQPD
jgi:hypothetical protein